jgi:hypothetical protein
MVVAENTQAVVTSTTLVEGNPPALMLQCSSKGLTDPCIGSTAKYSPHFAAKPL